MKLCFVLPDHSSKPVGGYKMVFEYANRLCERGYDVSILFLNIHPLERFNLPFFTKKIAVNYLTKIEPKWFSLDNRVKKISGLSKKYKESLKDIDIFIATAVETAIPTFELSANRKKFYFIQDFETWYTSKEEIIDTFKMDFQSIVISSWLKDIVDLYSEKKAILIRNPIDLSLYRQIIRPEERNPHTIGLLYNKYPHKGLKYSFQALEKLKVDYPDLSVEMFGNPNKPSDLPSWIKYTKNASKEKTVEIYNSVAVFMCSSVEEGYGLTGLESMACGAALATSNYKGSKEYAINHFNSLVCSVKDVDGMVENVKQYFDNPEYKYQIVRNAIQCIKNYDWCIGLDKFEEVINKDER